MCGIFGIIDPNSTINQVVFKKALEKINHRGPDSTGTYFKGPVSFGHKRLSIIDLSNFANQPMMDSESGCVLVFNGEIYNYIELRNDLKKSGVKFKTNSDSEVLLKLLIQKGEHALSLLNGMWAFAFWDSNKNELLLSRDRFGVKPLFYSLSKDKIIFASEPKAILSIKPECMSPNIDLALDFLSQNTISTDSGNSFYRNIQEFPKASFAKFQLNGSITIKKFWHYPHQNKNNISYKDALEEFTYLFSKSIRYRLRSDVRVGLTLSGGVDSSLILSIANSFANNPLICLTSTYQEKNYSEIDHAKYVSQRCGSELYESYSIQKDWINELERVIWFMDSPNFSPAVFPLKQLMKLSKNMGLKVMLEGQGADELFGGYPQHTILNLINSNLGILEKFRLLNDGNKIYGIQNQVNWIVRFLFPKLYTKVSDNFGVKKFSYHYLKEMHFLNENRMIDFYKDKVKNLLLEDHSKKILPNLLKYGDSVSMSEGVETRNPFLDKDLVDWAFSLPSDIIFHGKYNKPILRDLLRNQKIHKIAGRDKKGYTTPVFEWMHGSSRDDVYDILNLPRTFINEFINIEKVKKSLIGSKKPNASRFFLYKLVTLRLWLKINFNE